MKLNQQVTYKSNNNKILKYKFTNTQAEIFLPTSSCKTFVKLQCNCIKIQGYFPHKWNEIIKFSWNHKRAKTIMSLESKA